MGRIEVFGKCLVWILNLEEWGDLFKVWWFLGVELRFDFMFCDIAVYVFF